MTALPVAFLRAPLAHRALHGPGRPENSPAAIRAAMAAGYGIEIDVQLSADGQAMVFHDYGLDRLTGEGGPVKTRSAADLGRIALSGSDAGDTIPPLAQVLEIVQGKVPLLIEIKDQDRAFGPDVGPLERATAQALEGYRGDVAVMSFNPYSVSAFGQGAPGVPRGLTTCAAAEYAGADLPPDAVRALADIRFFDEVGASFISHRWTDLSAPAVARLKARGVPILCWTIRSATDEATARQVADNITFEGYRAAGSGA